MAQVQLMTFHGIDILVDNADGRFSARFDKGHGVTTYTSQDLSGLKRDIYKYVGKPIDQVATPVEVMLAPRLDPFEVSLGSYRPVNAEIDAGTKKTIVGMDLGETTRYGSRSRRVVSEARPEFITQSGGRLDIRDGQYMLPPTEAQVERWNALRMQALEAVNAVVTELHAMFTTEFRVLSRDDIVLLLRGRELPQPTGGTEIE